MTTIYRAHIETGYIEYLNQTEAEAVSSNIEIIERDLTPPVIEEQTTNNGE